jgi:anti-anti-sigma regulatory factor
MAKPPAKLVVLPAVLDLDALDGVRDGLLVAMEAGPVTVSGGGVERVSTNALLMLVSAAETARRTDEAFRVANASPALLAAIDRLGLGAAFSGLMERQ